MLLGCHTAEMPGTQLRRTDSPLKTGKYMSSNPAMAPDAILPPILLQCSPPPSTSPNASQYPSQGYSTHPPCPYNTKSSSTLRLTSPTLNPTNPTPNISIFLFSPPSHRRKPPPCPPPRPWGRNLLLPHIRKVLHRRHVGVHEPVHTVGQAALLVLVERAAAAGGAEEPAAGGGRGRGDAFFPADCC